MSYSEEEIQKYLNILQTVNDSLNVVSSINNENIPLKTPEKVSCENCGNTHFCKKCLYSVGRVFIKEITFKDRCCFRQKCITRENIIIKIK